MIELIPQTYLATLDLIAIFGRSAPLHVDLGCGEGSFLNEQAQRLPEKNFLGIERLARRVEKACRKAQKTENMRVLCAETSYAVRYLLPENSVETFYLLFPDPWPKRRHHRRRIFSHELLDQISTALREKGLFRIATDQLDYFHQIEQISGAHPRFEIIDQDAADLPQTKFEKRFHEQGAPIYRLALRKLSPVM